MFSVPVQLVSDHFFVLAPGSFDRFLDVLFTTAAALLELFISRYILVKAFSFFLLTTYTVHWQNSFNYFRSALNAVLTSHFDHKSFCFPPVQYVNPYIISMLLFLILDNLAFVSDLVRNCSFGEFISFKFYGLSSHNDFVLSTISGYISPGLGRRISLNRVQCSEIPLEDLPQRKSCGVTRCLCCLESFSDFIELGSYGFLDWAAVLLIRTMS